MHKFAEVMFTESVKAEQSAWGSRENYATFEDGEDSNDELTLRELDFIEDRDSFYMATVNEDGWPYVQHRGGAKGFLKVLGPNKLAFADFRGNRQFVSAGNARTNDRVSLILVDYPNRMRLKVIGHLRFVNAKDVPAEEFEALRTKGYRGLAERVAYIDVVGYDWNCPQHIKPRFTAEQLAELGIEVDLKPGRRG